MNKLAIFLLIAIVLISGVHAAAYDNSTAFGINGPALSVSLVNQDPDPAISGSTLDLRLAVQNGGQSDVNNVVVEIIPSYPFSLVSGQNAQQEVGTIGGYQGQYNKNQQIIKYTLLVDRDVAAGTYNLKVNVYQSGAAGAMQQTIPIEVKGKQSAEVIHIDKSVIQPGTSTPLTFTINNVGTSPLKDLTFSWNDANDVILPVGSDNTQYIKYIDVGGSVDVHYQVVADTNANPGLYKLNLRLTYVDPQSGQQNITTQAGVYVGGGTDFDVAYSDSGTGQTAFSVANTGSNPAYSVSVVIPDQPGWTVSGSNSAIIGNLNKGDYTIASFSLQSLFGNASNAPSGRFDRNMTGESNGTRNATQMVRVQVVYSDTTGQRQTVEKLVKVGSGGAMRALQRTTTQTSSNYKWYIIAIILIVVGYFGHKWYQRRKLDDTRVKKK